MGEVGCHCMVPWVTRNGRTEQVFGTVYDDQSVAASVGLLHQSPRPVAHVPGGAGRTQSQDGGHWTSTRMSASVSSRIRSTSSRAPATARTEQITEPVKSTGG